MASQFIRRFGLRTGDVIKGNLRINSQGEKFSALLYMEKVNGRSPAYLYTRKRFEDLTPIFPNERIHLETPGVGVSMRMLAKDRKDYFAKTGGEGCHEKSSEDASYYSSDR